MRFCDCTGVVAGIEQQETTGSVGRLGHSRLEAGLADQRRLLVARDAADRDGTLQEAGCGLAEVAAAVLHVRHERARHVEQAQQLVVPFAAVNVEQHRARGVRHVGRVNAAARQPPQQESSRSCRTRARRARRALARPTTLSRIQRILVPEKYGSSRSPVRRRTRSSAPSLRSLAHAGAVRRSCQTMARWIGSPLAPVPHDCRFALVGDPDRGDTLRARPAPVDGLAHRRQRVAPDVLGVVLDPSRSRVVLREFAPRQRHGLAALIEYDAARRGRALVNGEDVSGMAHRSGRSVSFAARSRNRAPS